ncbi:hypothetical protein BDV25DRAFT_146096 [Aspergillus avenaceus]|uniref:Uncharacterized protein n=1 Tax=Aspergillus avenaceus TaxID=36643 RepID=A0A5N6TCP2_ASPAV|nr:hypothetical protein BDV25DRAFT_146096 [Aspergillus avenaceus]
MQAQYKASALYPSLLPVVQQSESLNVPGGQLHDMIQSQPLGLAYISFLPACLPACLLH